MIKIISHRTSVILWVILLEIKMVRLCILNSLRGSNTNIKMLIRLNKMWLVKHHRNSLNASLTASHLALDFSSSNLANSWRSWTEIRSFHTKIAASPSRRIAPATERATTKTSGPLGHSEHKSAMTKDWFLKKSPYSTFSFLWIDPFSVY